MTTQSYVWLSGLFVHEYTCDENWIDVGRQVHVSYGNKGVHDSWVFLEQRVTFYWKSLIQYKLLNQ